MTARDEARAKCIEAMVQAYILRLKEYPLSSIFEGFTAAFDSLHGIARVNPIEATEEMMAAINLNIIRGMSANEATYYDMSAAGDLTNPPETKP
jgi:hypothetical protein